MIEFSCDTYTKSKLVFFSTSSYVIHIFSQPTNMIIRCVAIIGKKNNPLYIKIFHKDLNEHVDLFEGEEIHYHFLVHASLDCIDEKLTRKHEDSAETLCDVYLGLLYYLEDLRIYGLMTTTFVKFIIIVEASVEPKEIEVRPILKKIHDAYIQVVSNPFYPIGDFKQQSITSEKFSGTIQTIVDSVNHKKLQTLGETK